MKDKSRKINVLEIILSVLEGKCGLYHHLLFFNSFLISNPKLNIDFPLDEHASAFEPFRDLGMTEDIDPFEAIIQLSKRNVDDFKIDELKKELEKKAEDINNLCDCIRKINIRDKESFWKINDCFYMIDFILQKTMVQQHENPLSVIIMDIKKEGFMDVYHCVDLAQELIRKYSQLIGYWTAKIEKRGKNPGADAMKKRGEDNAKAIKDVLTTLEIKDTGIFRHDKKLREMFFSMVKQMADCTSEDRILTIARSLRG